jgi:hypothetical protein
MSIAAFDGVVAALLERVRAADAMTGEERRDAHRYSQELDDAHEVIRALEFKVKNLETARDSDFNTLACLAEGNLDGQLRNLAQAFNNTPLSSAPRMGCFLAVIKARQAARARGKK